MNPMRKSNKIFNSDFTISKQTRFSKILKSTSVSLLFLILLITGCKKEMEETGTKGICPEVTSTNPANLATSVSINTTVSAKFNEAMDAATINNSTFLLSQGTVNIPVIVSYRDSMAIFTPSTVLALNTTYTGTITKGVKDSAGNSMVSNYVWTFTTGASTDITAPTVISTDPSNGAIGVALNKKISASFSEAMNPATITNLSFTLKQGTNLITGVVSYSGVIALFSP